jgi:hypothetical protein
MERFTKGMKIASLSSKENRIFTITLLGLRRLKKWSHSKVLE